MAVADAVADTAVHPVAVVADVAVAVADSDVAVADVAVVDACIGSSAPVTVAEKDGHY